MLGMNLKTNESEFAMLIPEASGIVLFTLFLAWLKKLPPDKYPVSTPIKKLSWLSSNSAYSNEYAFRGNKAKRANIKIFFTLILYY